MASLASPLFWQIHYLAENLNKKNYKNSVAELNQLIHQYGEDARSFLLTCLIREIDFKEQRSHSGHQQKDVQKIQLLSHEMAQATTQPNFASIVSQAIENSTSVFQGRGGNSPLKVTEEFLTQFCRVLRLPLAQQVSVAVGLCDSTTSTTKQETVKFLKLKVPEFANSGAGSLPPDVLHSLLFIINNHEEFLSNPRLAAQCLRAVKLAHPHATDSVELIPLLGEEGLCTFHSTTTRNGNIGSIAMDIFNDLRADDSIAALMEDLGYTTTSSAASFREFLTESGVGITAAQVAEMVMMLVRTREGLETDASHVLCSGFLPLSGANDWLGETESSEYNGPTSWNLEAVAAVLRQDTPQLQWDEVALSLDNSSFFISDQEDLVAFLATYRGLSGADFPLRAIYRKWKNRAGQLSFLRHALVASPETLMFGGPSSNLHAVFQDVAGIHQGTPNQAWRSLDVLSTLLWLSETEHYSTVRSLFTEPMQTFPELLLAGLAQAASQSDTLKSEIFAELLPAYFPPNPSPASADVLRKLWALNRSVVVRGVVTVVKAGVASKTSLMDYLLSAASQLPDSMATLLDTLPVEQSIEMASMGADREMIHLEMWLSGRLVGSGIGGGAAVEAVAEFAAATVRFLKAHFPNAQPRPVPVEGVAVVPAGCLSLESMVVFLRTLTASQANLPEHTQQAISELANACVAAHPTLQELNAPNVEARANAYFSKIYAGEISIDEVVDMLTRFKKSEDTTEAEIFGCMVHNLFDEYRFFHRYPDKELRITGVLFGNLIQHDLVSNVTLGIALRYVLEALRNNTEQMVQFGLIALEQFWHRLHEWPPYCHHICTLDVVRRYKPEVLTKLEQLEKEGLLPEAMKNSGAPPGAAAVPPAAGTSAPGSNPGGAQPAAASQPGPGPGQNQGPEAAVASAQPIVSAALPTGQVENGHPEGRDNGGGGANAPAATDSRQEQSTPEPPTRIVMEKVMRNCPGPPEVVSPPDAVQDRLHFIINNLSLQNMHQKVVELRAIVKAEYYSWLGEYLLKRVCNQNNFHAVFLSLLTELSDKALWDILEAYTFQSIRRLLSSDKVVTESSERLVLKNLGSWLGELTLGRGRPLLQVKLDLKELLFNGYEAGRLIAVMPFVAKVLEVGSRSPIFRHPNPWSMMVIGLMRTLYFIPDLKMNICFEVEMIAKHFQLKMEDIVKYPGLEKRIPPRKDGNADLNVKKLNLAMSSNSGSFSGQAGSVQQEASREELHSVSAALSSGRQTAGTAEGVSGVGAESAQPGSVPGEPGQVPTGFQENTVIPNLAAYVTINTSLNLFNQHPHLKRVVPVAVDRAIREIIQPVVERSVTIACITSRELILKDFAMESDEARVRKAAHLMVSNLSGSLALVTCKEPLRVSMSNHLRTLLATASSDQVLAEQVVQICSADNLELGCMLIEKAATEKAMRDVDDQLAAAFSARRKAAERREPFRDMSVYHSNTRYPSSLPEQLFPKPGGGLHPQHLLVYEAFQRVPRQPPAAGGGKIEGGGGSIEGEGKKGSDASVEQLAAVVEQVRQMVQTVHTQAQGREITLGAVPAEHQLHQLLRDVTTVGMATPPNMREEVVQGLASKVFQELVDMPPSPRDVLMESVLVGVLKALYEVVPGLKPELTRKVLSLPSNTLEDKRGVDLIIGFIASSLVIVADVDLFLARNMEGGRKTVGVEMAMYLLQTCCMKQKLVRTSEVKHTIDMLGKIAKVAGKQPKYAPLVLLVEHLRVAAAAEEAAALAGVPVPRPDPPGVRDKVTLLLEHWLRVWAESPGSEKAYAQYLKMLADHGVLQSDENIERFFRITCELVITNCLGTAAAAAAAAAKSSNSPSSEGEKAKGKRDTLNYGVVDTYSKLIVLVVKYTDPNNTNTKINLLSRVLSTICQVLVLDHSRRNSMGTKFDQRPYFRLLVTVLQELHQPDPVLDTTNVSVLAAFANIFFILRPGVVPGFAFAWLELISHRVFMPTLLQAKNQKGWHAVHRLFMALFSFLGPQLRSSKMTDSVRVLYKGVLRVLLVILHDFPEFVCDYHFSFCDVIPPSCIHMRNLVLSAFPRNMRLPDPFTPNLKVDMLPEILQSPQVLSNFAAALQAEPSLRAEVDGYMSDRQPMSLLLDLPSKLLLSPNEASAAGTRYNVPLINSVVLYVGANAVAQMQGRSAGSLSSLIPNSPAMDVFQQLAKELAPEGRYLFLNAIANQLRYPNNHTHYFSCVLLFLFSEAREEVVQEQITRVLLERLIVHRPHPWGLLITFIELIKNAEYNFWSHNFTRCAPEVERLFESVARSCMQSPGGGSGVGAGALGGGAGGGGASQPPPGHDGEARPTGE